MILAVSLALVVTSADGGAEPEPLATYRVIQRECSRCSAEGAATELRGAADCGALRGDVHVGRWRHCVLDALDAGRPFRAALVKDGSEVFGRQVDGGLIDVWRHAPEEEQGCRGIVFKEHCSRLSLFEAGDCPTVECVRADEPGLEPACSEQTTRASLGPPLSVGRLRCGWRVGDEYRRCGPNEPSASGFVPPSTGPDLLCRESGDLRKGLVCLTNRLDVLLPPDLDKLSGVAPARLPAECRSAALVDIRGLDARWEAPFPGGGVTVCPISQRALETLLSGWMEIAPIIDLPPYRAPDLRDQTVPRRR